MAAKCVAGLLEARAQTFYFAPEITTVIHETQMGQFVGDDIVNDGLVEVDQAPVQHDFAR